MEDIYQYFWKLGINKKESDICLTVWKLWAQPASTIARVSGHERVYTYTVLKKITKMWIISTTRKKGVNHFWIPSLENIRVYIEQKQKKRETIHETFDVFKSQVTSLSQQHSITPPKINIFEEAAWIRALCETMLQTIQQKKLLTIKLFATHTFQDQLLSKNTSWEYLAGFLTELQKQKVSIKSYIAEWWMTMEQLKIIEHMTDIIDLPAWNNAVNLFVVGTSVFLIIYKDIPVGIQFESPEYARAMHFLLEELEKTK